MHSENALDVLFRLGKNMKYATGVNCIDNYLNGGFEPGEIYEIVGEQAVGKTQILYGVAASYLCVHSGNIAWIDLNGSFVPTRFLQFFEKFANEKRGNLDRSDILRRVFVAHAFNSGDIIAYLQQILHQNPKVSLVLIDNIGSILTRSAFSCNKDGRNQITSVIENMKKCSSKGLTVMVTNHLIDVNGDLRPALGMYWKKNVTKRYLIGKNTKSNYFRPASQEEESFRTNNQQNLCFTIDSRGISEYDDLLL